MPIGQVFFVPREEITMRNCTKEEIVALGEAAAAFRKEKASLKQTTNYGLQYSPLYSRRSHKTK
jgi:hypothetical protein